MSTPTISVEELRRGGDPAPVLIDVRTGAEWESLHIPGTVNVPQDRLSEFAPQLAQLQVPLVTVCQTGTRAEQCLVPLAAAGVADVKVLEGGTAAWQESGAPVEQGKQRWAMDRQVRGVAGALVLVGMILGSRVRMFRLLAWLVGGGLFYSAVSNSCFMAMGLAKLPYNKTQRDTTADVAALVERVKGEPSLRMTA